MEQLSLFTTGEDTPLFSGTPIKADLSTYQPVEHIPQTSLAHCKTCLDTGKIGNRYCMCKAGVEALALAHRIADERAFSQLVTLCDRHGETRIAPLKLDPSIARLEKAGKVECIHGNTTVRLTLPGCAEPTPPLTPDDLFREVLKDHDTWRHGDADRGTPLDWYQHDGATAALWLDLYASGRIDLFADPKGRKRVRLPLVDQPRPESKSGTH
jgi:hypothetical protein